MKQLFEMISRKQGEYAVKNLQKKEVTNLGTVAGVNFGGKISGDEYKTILNNLEGYSKDWKRFKGDSTKIVLEKHSMLRTLKGLKMFFFRHLSGDGCHTNLLVSNEFRNGMLHNYGFEVVIMTFLMMALACIPAFFLGGVLHHLSFEKIGMKTSSVIFWLFFLALRIRYIIICRKWKKNDSQNVGKMFNDIISTVNYSSDKTVSVSVCPNVGYGKVNKANTNEAHSALWYETTLKELTVLASKLDGQIGWIWDYGTGEGKDIYRLNVDESKPYNTGDISVENRSDNILFFIETAHSFIFHFPAGYKGWGGFERAITLAEKNIVKEKFQQLEEKIFLPFK